MHMIFFDQKRNAFHQKFAGLLRLLLLIRIPVLPVDHTHNSSHAAA